MSQGKIGLSEAICLLIVSILAKSLLSCPGVMVSYMGNTVWYGAFICAGSASLGFTFIYLLLRQHHHNNLYEIYQSVMGSFTGRLFSLLLAVTLLVDSAILLREFTDTIKIYALPQSPPVFIAGIFIAGVAGMCLLGLESMARFAKLVSCVLVAVLILLLILVSNRYQLHRMFPPLGYGFDKTLIFGFANTSLYGIVIFLAVFATSIQGVKHIKKTGYVSIITAGILISAAFSAFILTFGYNTAQELTSPVYEMVKLINFGIYIQRFDPVFFFVWNISAFISVTLMLYTSITVYCRSFGIKKIKPLIVLYAVILLSLSMLPKNMPVVARSYSLVFSIASWIIYFLCPIIVLIVSTFKRKAGKQSHA